MLLPRLALALLLSSVTAGMDKSVAPGDDFYAYANGGWLKGTSIPADRSSYGTGAQLSESTAKRTAELVKSAPPGQIKDFYLSFMDEQGIEKKGLAPLKPALEAIAAIKDYAALCRALGGTLRADVDVLNSTQLHSSNLFGLWVAQDLDNPAAYAPFLLQGGLGMPDRDYYLDTDERSAGLRTAYTAHIAAMLKLAKDPDAAAKAARIFELEKKLAAVHLTRTESEDVEKGNNHWPRAELEKKAPGIHWESFLSGAGLDKQPVFVAWQPAAIAGISALVKQEPVETWKEYLAFHTLDRAAPYLPKAFVDEDFAFNEKTLNGTQALRARWKRAVRYTDAALGEAVGKLYVARYFPPAEKARAEEMVKNEIAAFGRRVDALGWMAPQTKAKAKAKLAALKVDVGYPDRWRDYSGLEVVRGDALGNARRAELFDYHRNLEKLGKPVDRGEWVMNPQLVNAVNLPAMNALNFPAAILQPPYFDSKRPAVLDYGCAGAIIGHEISHSFDDQGALFDETGRLKNWWTEGDFAHFKASSRQLIEQFDAYHPFPDRAVNGKLTVSENIADVAGLSVAYDAYRLSLGGKEAKTVDGFTGDQQFFLSFAQCWRNKMREAALRQRLITDGHAPPEYRGDTVRNLDAWYDAFKVQPGQKLYLAPAERVRVW